MDMQEKEPESEIGEEKNHWCVYHSAWLELKPQRFLWKIQTFFYQDLERLRSFITDFHPTVVKHRSWQNQPLCTFGLGLQSRESLCGQSTPQRSQERETVILQLIIHQSCRWAQRRSREYGLEQTLLLYYLYILKLHNNLVISVSRRYWLQNSFCRRGCKFYQSTEKLVGNQRLEVISV